VVRLPSERDADGTIGWPPYRAKWGGGQWVLVTLVELGYPPGDATLMPLAEQALGWPLSAEYETTLIGRVQGRVWMHAAIDANLVRALLKLGLADQRVDQLIDRILAGQWPDGGWNCDRRARAGVSSFTETLIPLRALALHADRPGSPSAGLSPTSPALQTRCPHRPTAPEPSTR
jgi:hypothetical protein